MKLFPERLRSALFTPDGVTPTPDGGFSTPTGGSSTTAGGSSTTAGGSSTTAGGSSTTAGGLPAPWNGLIKPADRLLRAGLRGVRNLLYPPFCTVCALPTLSGKHLCAECAAEAMQLRWGAPASCRRCSQPFWGAEPLPEVCVECRQWTPAFDCVVAPCRFGGVVREVVHQLKYDGKRHLRHLVCEWMQEGLLDSRLRDPPVEMLVPVPLHWWKHRLRGFNQAEVLATALSGSSGVQMLGALRRVRPTGTQTQLAREERRANVRGAFAARPRCERRIQGKHVLLVDDVLTTGATLDACAGALLKGGAASVRALTAARG